jgi:hypothetical protein
MNAVGETGAPDRGSGPRELAWVQMGELIAQMVFFAEKVRHQAVRSLCQATVPRVE